MATIRVFAVGVEPDRRAGAVTYELRDGEEYRYMRQPFRRGPHGRDASGVWWGWDGLEPITLEPSFRCDNGREHVHLFFRAGRIDLCKDSNVVLLDE